MLTSRYSSASMLYDSENTQKLFDLRSHGVQASANISIVKVCGICEFYNHISFPDLSKIFEL